MAVKPVIRSAPKRRLGRPRKSELQNGKPTRERILDAAAELFALKGFDATPMDEIAARAGLTVGALYRHFDAKGDLLLDVVRHALTSLPIAQHMRGDRGRVELLPEMVSLYMEPSSRRLRRLVSELHAAAGRNPRVARLFREFSDRMARDTRDRIVNGVAEGAIVGAPDPDLAARLMIVILAGLAHLDSIFPALLSDERWRQFVLGEVARLLGLPPAHSAAAT